MRSSNPNPMSNRRRSENRIFASDEPLRICKRSLSKLPIVDSLFLVPPVSVGTHVPGALRRSICVGYQYNPFSAMSKEIFREPPGARLVRGSVLSIRGSYPLFISARLFISIPFSLLVEKPLHKLCLAYPEMARYLVEYRVQCPDLKRRMRRYSYDMRPVPVGSQSHVAARLMNLLITEFR